jgi:hypothetical protein
MQQVSTDPAVTLDKWLSSSPYKERNELIKTMSDTQHRWHCFCWYVEDIVGYGKWSRYAHIAQIGWASDAKTLCSILWPGTSCQSPEMILEISKRQKAGTMPQTEQEAAWLVPSIVINYAGQTHMIALDQDIEGKNRHNILNDSYAMIKEKLQALPVAQQTDATIVKDIVIRVLRERKHLRVALKKSLPSIKGRRRRLLQLFWLNKKSEDSAKKDTMTLY